jgi:hypothetical protein
MPASTTGATAPTKNASPTAEPAPAHGPAVQPVPRTVAQWPAKALQPPGVSSVSWVCTLPAGTTLEDVLSPSMWRAIGFRNDLKTGDVIDVRSDDLSLCVDVVVLFANALTGEVFVRPKPAIDAEPNVIPGHQEGAYRSEWAGVTNGWIIRRITDDTIVRKGIRTSDQARSILLTEFAIAPPSRSGNSFGAMLGAK